MSRDDTFNRRSILKGIGSAAAGGAALAASGLASADDPGLEAQYADRTSLRGAFEKHAADLPAALADAGVVSESFDFESLDTDFDADVTRMQPTDADGRAGVTTVSAHGPRSALGMISTSTDAHEIALYVQPQRGDSYAIVQPKDGGSSFVVTDDDEVTTLGCVYSECTCERCYNPDGVMYYVQEHYQCNVDCTDCWVEGTDCTCTDIC